MYRYACAAMRFVGKQLDVLFTVWLRAVDQASSRLKARL